MKNLKRFLSFLLAVTMLTALGITASAAEFTDVPAGSDYAEAVQWAAEHGYVNGPHAPRNSAGAFLSPRTVCSPPRLQEPFPRRQFSRFFRV